MTDRDHLEHLLLPPDPEDAPGWRNWPAPARRRLALCALLDRIAEVTAGGERVRVLVPAEAWQAWRGLGAALDAYGMAASVAAAGGEQGVERVAMPVDAAAARRGAYGVALLGAAATPVRYVGITVAGDDTAASTGPWQAVTDEGWRAPLARAALLDPVLSLRPGQRLQALVMAVGEPSIVSAWH